MKVVGIQRNVLFLRCLWKSCAFALAAFPSRTLGGVFRKFPLLTPFSAKAFLRCAYTKYSEKPMNLQILRRVALALVVIGTGAAAHAQDLIARQAPVDRRLRSVDSISIQRAVERELNNDLSSDIYTSWVTTKAHPYKSADVPETYKIDLRGFCMPTPSRQLTSHYGYRPAFKRVHKGLDIKVLTGDTIVAAFDGKVRVVRYDAGGYGNYVVIRHNNGLETIYGHLSKQLVESDQMVKAGEPIGLGGNTGRSFGSHLHFETRIAGEPIDPELLFNFPMQDVTGDYYTFHRNSGTQRNEALLASKGVIDEDAVAMTATHFYKVSQGETFTSIASKLGMNEEKLAKINRLNASSRLRKGQILRY